MKIEKGGIKTKMKKKTKAKQNKGITLIALIVTIVVLLILTSVSITVLFGENGIIEAARNARIEATKGVARDKITTVMGAWTIKQLTEDQTEGAFLNFLNTEFGEDNVEAVEEGSYNVTIDGYTFKVEENGNITYASEHTTGGGVTQARWVNNGDGTITKGETTVNIGDYVNYVSGVEGYDDENGWRVLGVNNGKLTLISSDSIGDLTLSGLEGYKTGISQLNTMCADFGEGTYAEGAKSVTIEDINEVTGFNPLTADDEYVSKGEIYEYGKTITYTLSDGGKISYTDGESINGTSDYTIFKHPNGNMLKAGTDTIEGYTRVSSIQITNNSYYYDPSDGYLDNTSTVYEMLVATRTAFSGLGTVDPTDPEEQSEGISPYWLPSNFELACEGYADFGLWSVDDGYIGGDYNPWSSYNYERDWTLGVRAVVTLQSEVVLGNEGEGDLQYSSTPFV